MSIIFATGDTHCNARGEFSKLSTKNFHQQKELSKDDFVLIAGDFGCLWCDSGEEHYWLDWLEAKPFTGIATRKLPNFSSARGIAAKDNGSTIQILLIWIWQIALA